MAIDNREEAFVRVYYKDDPRLAHTISGRLQKEINTRAGQTAKGLAADWGDYQRRVGVQEGLEIALRMANETEAELRGDRDARRSA